MSVSLLRLLAGLTAGAAGALGLGGGSVLILWLTLAFDMPQKQAQGINLVFFLPTAAVALIYHNAGGMVKWRAALKLAAVGLIGVGAGFLLARYLPAQALRRVFALFLMLLGTKELFWKNERRKEE